MMQRLMVECAVRAALIALGTAAVLRLLRVKSPGARHAAWAGVLALMLLLPAWTAWGPRASAPLLPAAPMPILHLAGSLPVEALPAAPAPRPVHWNWVAAIYLPGVFILLTRLALGTLRARALVRRAERREGRLTSPSCAAPVTVGCLRPMVILPQDWCAWPPAQLDAVLAHEGEHVRRRDPLVEWLALLNRAIFWFHPLAWWLERRLSALAEEACDAAVLERGHDPCDYSEYLLELARSVGRSGVRLNVVGMAMPGSSLPQRIRRILTRGPAPRLTRGRAVCLAAAFVTVSAVFAAATVDRQQSIPDPPLPPAPPAPVAAPAPAPPPLPPVPPQPPQEQRLIVLYFDFAGLPAESQARAIAYATKFVEDQTARVAIVTWSGGAKVVQDFTADHDKLTGAIQHLSVDNSEDFDADKQLARLLAVTRMLGPLTEKKQLVYFTTPALRQSATEDQLRPVINAAQRANVAFYPVDVSAPTVIGAGDTITMSVSDPQSDRVLIYNNLTVSSDGMVSIPLAQVGDIKAVGLTSKQLLAAIMSRIAAHEKTPKAMVLLDIQKRDK